MRLVTLPALILAALAMLNVHTYAALLYNYTIYYPNGTNGVNITVLMIPGHICGVVENGEPLPHACFNVDGYTVIAAREPAGPARSVTWTIGMNVSAPWPFVNESTIYLIARCRSSITSDTGYTYGWTPQTLVALSEPVNVYVENVTVYLYVIYGSAANVYVYSDGVLVWSATDVTSVSRTLYSLYSRNITIYANSTGSSYVILYYEIYYYPPVYNATSITLSYPFVYIEAAGRGSLSISGYNVSFSFMTTALSSVYPPLVAVNGSIVQVEPGAVTVATSCYGSNVTSLAIVHYAVANITRYEVLSSQGYYYNAPAAQQQVTINANVTVSTAELAASIMTTASYIVALGAPLAAALLPSPWFLVGFVIAAVAMATSVNPVTVGMGVAAIAIVLYRVMVEELRW